MSTVTSTITVMSTSRASSLTSREPSRAALRGSARPSTKRRPKMATSANPKAVFTGGGNRGSHGGESPGENAAQLRRREQEKEQRRKAAQRVVRSAAGVSRAEALRIGLDQRSSYSVLDFLRSEDILGPAPSSSSTSSSADQPQGPSTPINAKHHITDMPPAFVNEDALAEAFGLHARGAGGLDGDEDRENLFKLARRMDPFAQRALLYNRPSRVRHLAPRVLSSLLVDDAMYVQRFATQDERGEAATLTLRMTLEERLAPNYKSATVFEQWVVHSVTGEPSDGAELPAQPHASCSPESVVNAQLDALKWDDAERCVRFASPRNVAKTVDADVFKEMLSTPAYAPLSDPEAHCTIARTVQLSADSFAAVVTCRSWNHAQGVSAYESWNLKGRGRAPPRYFVWLLSRQPGSGRASATDLAAAAAVGGEVGSLVLSKCPNVDVSGCWLTDAVMPARLQDLKKFGV